MSEGRPDWYKEYIERKGDQRERALGFRKEVLSAFGFFLMELGFHCVSADPLIVRFESDKMFFQISHDVSNYSIELAIGKLDDLSSDYTLRNIVRDHLNASGYEEYGKSAGNAEKVHKRVQQIAEMVKKYAVKALKGDEEFLRGVAEAASRVNAEYNRRMRGD
jgi:hypothetical protein